MDIKFFISIISPFISIISLVFAFRVYKVFHNREIQKKQMDIVLSLIKNIQENSVSLTWVMINEKSVGQFYLSNGNLLTVEKNFRTDLNKKLKELVVYFSEETNNRLKVEEFLFNPLLPKNIADCLKIVFPDEISYADGRKQSKDFIYIDESRILDAKALKENFPLPEELYHCTYNANLGGFIIGINLLKLSINKWLKEVGVKDLNIFWEN